MIGSSSPGVCFGGPIKFATMEDNSICTENDSSSSPSSSDEEIYTREEYFEELQFYYENWTIEEIMGQQPFHDHLARTHIEQMELFMRTVRNGDYDEEMERDLRYYHHFHRQLDFPEVVVLPAEWEERQRIEKENIKNELRKFIVDD